MTNYFFNKHELNNGIEVYINSTPQFITTNMSLNFYTLLTEEAAKNTLLSEILVKGSKKYPTSKDVNSKLADLKGARICSSASKYAHLQEISFDIQALTKPVYKSEETPFDESLKILKDVLTQPYLEDGVFSKKYVQQEKENLKRNIRELVNAKQSYSLKRLKEELYPNNPFGLNAYGNIEHIDTLDEEKLYKHYLNLPSESNIKIFITGSKTEEEYLQQIESHFSKLSPGKTLTDLMKSKPDNKLDFSRKINPEKMRGVNESQLWVIYQHDINPKDEIYPALVFYNALLGGTSSSKLFKEIREKHSLAYGTYSYLFSATNLLTCWAGIGDHKTYDKTVDLMKEQINLLKKGDFTGQEINNMRKYLIDTDKRNLDSPSARINKISSQVLNDTFDLQDYSYKEIKSVKKKDIQSIAKMFDADKCLIYFLRPK